MINTWWWIATVAQGQQQCQRLTKRCRLPLICFINSTVSINKKKSESYRLKFGRKMRNPGWNDSLGGVSRVNNMSSLRVSLQAGHVAGVSRGMPDVPASRGWTFETLWWLKRYYDLCDTSGFTSFYKYRKMSIRLPVFSLPTLRLYFNIHADGSKIIKERFYWIKT